MLPLKLEWPCFPSFKIKNVWRENMYRCCYTLIYNSQVIYFLTYLIKCKCCNWCKLLCKQLGVNSVSCELILCSIVLPRYQIRHTPIVALRVKTWKRYRTLCYIISLGTGNIAISFYCKTMEYRKLQEYPKIFTCLKYWNTVWQ